MQLLPLSTYVRELRPALPAEAFEPATSRLWFVPVFLALIAVSAVAIAASWVPWFVVPIISLVIGGCFAGLTFIGHEAVHGGIVRGRVARHVLGFIGFLPFT